MFRTPEVMRNILFNSYNALLESDDYQEFLKSNGIFVRCLKIFCNSDVENCLKDFLVKTPNLEQLTIENPAPVIRVFKRPRRGGYCCGRPANLRNDDGPFNDSDSTDHDDSNSDHDDSNSDNSDQDDTNFDQEYWQPNENSVELPKLRILQIERRDIKHFLNSTKSVQSLTKLSVSAAGFDKTDDKILSNFVSKQNKLKELSVTASETQTTLTFPSHDISSDVKFKLKKIQLHTSYNRDEHFSKFLDVQAESLVELDLNHSLDDESLDVIFVKARRLEKFIQKRSEYSKLFKTNHPEWCHETLKHYEDQGLPGVKLECVAERFPNLQMLKCKSIEKSSGIHSQLTFLEVDNLDINNLRNVQLTNLKKLTIGKVMKSQDDNSWQSFVLSNKNLDILEIKSIENIDDIPQILSALKLFENLQKFYLRHHPRLYRKKIIDGNETVPTGYIFFKVMIDMDDKTVKVSSYIVRKCKKILGILIRDFQNSKFYEFCFYVDEMLDINVEEHATMDSEIELNSTGSTVEDGASGTRRSLRNSSKRH